MRKRRISLLVAFYDTQGLRWVYSTPEPTGGFKFDCLILFLEIVFEMLTEACVVQLRVYAT